VIDPEPVGYWKSRRRLTLEQFKKATADVEAKKPRWWLFLRWGMREYKL
jgi:hypothetical protein